MSTATTTVNTSTGPVDVEVVEAPVAPAVQAKVSKPKPQSANDLKAAANATLAEAFEDLTTALSQSGAGVAAAESSAVAFVRGIASLRKARVTQAKVVEQLSAQATKQGVEVPFASAGYVTVAEVVGAILEKGEELGTVTRVRKDEDGKNEKFEASVIVRVDGFGGTRTGLEDAEIFSIVRAVVSPQGVGFLAIAGVDDKEYGKEAALKIVTEAEDASDAVRKLDERVGELKSKINAGRKLQKEENAQKEAKEVTGDQLIAALAKDVNKFLIALGKITESGDPAPVTQDSQDIINTLVDALEKVSTSAVEVVAAAPAV